MSLTFASSVAESLPLYLIDKAGFDAFLATRSAQEKAWIDATGFSAAAGSVCVLPGDDGVAGALVGLGGAVAAYGIVSFA